jgi:hypothetical protein
MCRPLPHRRVLLPFLFGLSVSQYAHQVQVTYVELATDSVGGGSSWFCSHLKIIPAKRIPTIGCFASSRIRASCLSIIESITRRRFSYSNFISGWSRSQSGRSYPADILEKLLTGRTEHVISPRLPCGKLDDRKNHILLNQVARDKLVWCSKTSSEYTQCSLPRGSLSAQVDHHIMITYPVVRAFLSTRAATPA